jgi:hypothetical protein
MMPTDMGSCCASIAPKNGGCARAESKCMAVASAARPSLGRNKLQRAKQTVVDVDEIGM